MSLLTSDIGFSVITATEFSLSINKLSTILFRRYNRYRWSVSINIPALAHLNDVPARSQQSQLTQTGEVNLIDLCRRTARSISLTSV